MKLLKMNKPQCVIYSIAMLFEIEPETVIKRIEHDGLSGVHIQEILDFVFQYGYFLVPIEVDPIGYDSRKNIEVPIRFPEGNLARVIDYLDHYDALLVGLHRASARHAVAWCHKTHQCYDPNGLIYPIKQFDLEEAWLKIKADC